MWGAIKSESQYAKELFDQCGKSTFPPIPGVFALRNAYEGTIIVIDPRCPARFVNDAKGTDYENNVHFTMNNSPRDLHFDGTKGLQMLLQAQATRPIAAGEQLFMDYGELFWHDAAPIKCC